VKTLQDFHRGDTWTTGGRTLTEAHVVAFSGLTGDFFPLHTDAVYAAKSQFGALVVQGPLVYASAVGLVSQSEVFGGAVLAFLGVTDLRHLNPCFVGTTIAVTVTVQDAHPAKRNPDQGVCTLRYDVLSSDGVELMTADMNFLMRTKVDA
jgi:acyl dehydratase